MIDFLQIVVCILLSPFIILILLLMDPEGVWQEFKGCVNEYREHIKR